MVRLSVGVAQSHVRKRGKVKLMGVAQRSRERAQGILANQQSGPLKSRHLHIQDTYIGPKCCVCMLTNP